MSVEGRPATIWRRLSAWLRTVGEATDLTYDDVQDRRIQALETEVAALHAALHAAPPAP